MRRVLIIGGGIAGPATAMALRQAGIDATVFEAYERTADGVGAFLTLAPNGMDALRALDLHEVVRAAGIETTRIRLTIGPDRPLGEASLVGERADGMTSLTLSRADLYMALRDEAVRRGIPVEYGKRLVDFADGVARFADGATAEGDLLVGADGLQSVVRTIIDPDAPAARYVPLLNTGGFAVGVDAGLEPGVSKMMFGKRAFFGVLPSPDGEAWWFANVAQRTESPPAALAEITSDAWRARLIDLFADDGDLPRRLIEATPVIMPPWNTYDFPRVPTWHRDRMVIIGDAAHATSPAAGQGASMALEDAVVLARCLRDLPTDRALRAYESLRRERVERVVRHGKRSGSAKALGPIGRVVLPALFKLMPTSDLRWMYDHHTDWNARVLEPV
uniref:FAD-dependent oxidoreductase n=1 Tax=Actinokineospora iranica TaxID=1271860 RepID=UPI000B8722FF